MIFIIICVCVLLCLVIALLTIWNEGYRIQEKEYYSDKSNFVSVTATCDELGINPHYPNKYFLNVEDMEYEKTEDCKFISLFFDINKANSAILKNAGIEEKLTKRKVFTFISAPEYFGDGYACHVVGVEIDGEVLLDFNTGYENLMDTYGNGIALGMFWNCRYNVLGWRYLVNFSFDIDHNVYFFMDYVWWSVHYGKIGCPGLNLGQP